MHKNETLLRTPLHIFTVITDWKAWPTELRYFPLTVYVIFAGLLRGKLFYCAAANPKIPLGGFAGDSKSEIFKHIPGRYKPKTVFISENDNDLIELLRRLREAGIAFPVIAKPDMGEAGFLVRKIDNVKDLVAYHYSHSMAYIIQEFIDLPVEVSVLFHKVNNRPAVSSFVHKEYLMLTGDGVSTIDQLLAKRLKGRLYFIVKRQMADKLRCVLNEGEKYIPSVIGNLFNGTRFTDYTGFIDQQLVETFDRVNTEIGLFNYARYDIKCQSIEHLKLGEFTILEINGIKGEATHLYDERVSLFQAYRIIFKHWNSILHLGRENIRQGVRCPGIREGFSILATHARAKKRALNPRGEPAE